MNAWNARAGYSLALNGRHGIRKILESGEKQVRDRQARGGARPTGRPSMLDDVQVLAAVAVQCVGG